MPEDTENTGIDFKAFFKDSADFLFNTFKNSLIERASQTKEVQDEVERQKVIAGKNILWQIFPFVVIGSLAVILIARFK